MPESLRYCLSLTPSLLAFASFERLDQRLADFVDISCTQSQHDVTRIEFSDELFGDLTFIRNKIYFHVSSSFDPLIQGFTGHAFNRILSCRVDLCKNESVGAFKGSEEVIKQISRATEAVRLKDHN